jgi:hypothetical protein
MLEKSICLNCGSFYKKEEMIGTICVWCSVCDMLDLSLCRSDVLLKELDGTKKENKSNSLPEYK